MKQTKDIEKIVSNIYDKLLSKKKNNSQKIISGAEFLNLVKSQKDCVKGKKVVVFLVDADVIFSDKKILIDDYEKDKNLRSLC